MKVVHSVLNMQKPYVFNTWGKNGINEDKPLCALGLVDKEAMLSPETKFIRIDADNARMEIGTYIGHISYRVLMRDPDFVAGNMRVKFHEEPQWEYVYVGELNEFFSRFGKLKMVHLADILEREINAYQREGKMPDKSG